MKKWILGLWMIGYSLGAYATSVIYENGELKLGSSEMGILSRGEKLEDSKPIRMAVLNYKVIRVVAHSENGLISVKEEPTECVGSYEIPVFDLREGGSIMIEQNHCLSTLYGKEVNISIMGVVALRSNGATHFLTAVSHDDPESSNSAIDFRFNSSGFSTRSNIRDATLTLNTIGDRFVKSGEFDRFEALVVENEILDNRKP